MRNYIKILVSMTLVLNLASAAWADDVVPNLNTLVARYLALPTLKDEKLVESILTNPMMTSAFAESNGDLDQFLESMNFKL